MVLYEKIKNQEESLSLVGLGYVGMPIAVEFAKRGVKVIGFDLNEAKIETYKSGIDPTNEVGDDVIKNTTIEFTANEEDLKRAKFHIVAVPDVYKRQSQKNIRKAHKENDGFYLFICCYCCAITNFIDNRPIGQN